jgi:transposase
VIKRLELRVAELERRLSMDSSNSSAPPSKDPLAAKARQKAARWASLRERSGKRKPGGQPGHEGSGLEPARKPDRTEQADPPAECRSCGTGLAGAEEALRRVRDGHHRGPAGWAGQDGGLWAERRHRRHLAEL